jgi:hypothetical protein
MKWKKGWKVINTDRTSVWIGGYGSRKYLPNKVIGRSTNCGPLCVFKNKAGAERYAKYDTIVPCLYLPSKHTSVWIKWGIRVPLESLPDHTALAEKVKCLA